MSKPLIAITMGDPAGIGPETIVGAWEAPILHDDCRAIVCGDVAVMRRAVKLVGGLREVIEISSPEEAVGHAKAIPCLPCCRDDAARVKPATIDARGGRAAHDALAAAAEFALSDRIDAIVTAPLNKVALHKAGYRYPGHTELLAELCNANNVAMMLYLAPCESLTGRIGLGVVHTTLHLALRDVFDQLTSDRIVTNARLASSFARTLLTEIGIDEPPRIGICALNPHAGEGGLFGDEERRIILPAVERCKADGLSVAGPLPCDTLIMRAAAGEFDAVVAMYHDQGHIALKLLGMHRAVNVTLGLPIIRTSVAHGTAFDLAWQGRAQSSGMVEAVKMAITLAKQKMTVGHVDEVTRLQTE